ncbi:hypothetical protein ILUMI_14713, partial [Ignelater luminosus]
KTLVKCVKDMNIGIFNPKKDRCDTCVQYESGNLNEEEYKIHRQEKARAQEEKAKDKEKAQNGRCHVIVMDL